MGVRALRTFALALAISLAFACGGTQKPRTRPAQLRTIVSPPTAAVHVDERFVGAARVLEKRPAALAPGKRRVTIEAPGYFPHDLEVELAPGVTTVEVKLRSIPP